MTRTEIKERRLEAVVVNVFGIVYQRYYHDNRQTLLNWMDREGFADSPDFNYFIRTNPFYFEEVAE